MCALRELGRWTCVCMRATYRCWNMMICAALDVCSSELLQPLTKLTLRFATSLRARAAAGASQAHQWYATSRRCVRGVGECLQLSPRIRSTNIMCSLQHTRPQRHLRRPLPQRRRASQARTPVTLICPANLRHQAIRAQQYMSWIPVSSASALHCRPVRPSAHAP